MSDYGSGAFTTGPYGGRKQYFSKSGIAVLIEHYDNGLGFKGLFQTGVGDFLGCNFTIDESGPRDFILFFSAAVNIEKKDIIKIKIFNSLDYFFTGVIRETPIDGSTKQEYNYTGFGLTDYFVRTNAEVRNYSSKTLYYIVDDILDNVLLPKAPAIIRNDSKIILPDITITSLITNYSQVTEVLRTLKKIAASDGNNYVIGVDASGEFFFKPRSQETIVSLVVGKRGNYGIDNYEPIDEIEQRTKYFVLDKDGNYVTTISSTEDNDIYEDKLTAPDLDNASIILWAQGILTESEIISRSATINWKIEPWDPILLVGDGNIRIMSSIPAETTEMPEENPYGSGVYGSGLYGGGQFTGIDIIDILRCVEVQYSLTAAQGIRIIQLGSLPIRLEDRIEDVRKELVDLTVSLGV